MNPMTNVKNVQKYNALELERGIAGTDSSWHAQYKDSAWIFIGGLNYDLTEGDVVCVFSQYGEIVNINLIRDKKTGKSKGFAFLCYENQKSTILAVDNLNGIKVATRTIRVDHVEEYKLPKDVLDEDELTKKIREQGIHPSTMTDSGTVEEEVEEEEEERRKRKKKKEKKEKKKEKKKREDREFTDREFKREPKDEALDVKPDLNDFDRRNGAVRRNEGLRIGGVTIKQEPATPRRSASPEEWRRHRSQHYDASTKTAFEKRRQSSPAYRRSRSPRRKRSMTPKNRQSPDRRSRSPEKRRMPEKRSSRSPNKGRSRSPNHRQSPDRRRLRSPGNSHSAEMRHSRSLDKGRSRSPASERSPSNKRSDRYSKERRGDRR